MSNYTVSFFGCGNIASAIITGIINSGYIKPSDIYGYDISDERRAFLRKIGACVLDDPKDVGKTDFTFITVKPQICNSVLPQLNGCIKGCAVTVVAGMKIAKLQEYLGNIPVIRVMPNTPIMVGQGATGLCKSNCVSNEQFDFIKSIFNKCGIACTFNEEQMDAVTGMSGSGPAYVFRFVKALSKAAQELGIEEKDAVKLACGTLRGGADMIEKSGMTVDELIKMVSSPNGTTVAGLKALDDNGFDNSVFECVKAATARSKELSV